jgi:hypothetical protein
MLRGNSHFILGVYSDILSALVDIIIGITVCFGFFNITVTYRAQAKELSQITEMAGRALLSLRALPNVRLSQKVANLEAIVDTARSAHATMLPCTSMT